MAVIALKPYKVPPKDSLDKFPDPLLYIGWEDHLMFCAPHCLPLPPDMPFGTLLEKVLPEIYGCHPDFARIDWRNVQWLKSGKPINPDESKTLVDNGLKHKDVLRFRTPGLTGIRNSFS